MRGLQPSLQLVEYRIHESSLLLWSSSCLRPRPCAQAPRDSGSARRWRSSSTARRRRSAGDHHARRARPGDRSRHQADRAAAGSTASWTKRSTRRPSRSAGCSRSRRTTAPQSTEKTDVWITYDENNIYVSARCWDSAPPEQWIANELRRDTNQLRQNDHFGVMFDTFYDRRSGFIFYTNPLGALADYSVVDEGESNTDWNPVWELADRHASRAAGRSRWRFRSRRSATAPATTRSGASSCGARSATRTSGPI